MKNIVVIVAAGNSTRCGFDKIFTDKFGVSVIEKTLSIFEVSDSVDEVVLVLSAKNFAKGASLQSQFPKITKVLLGGNERYESVKNAIEYLHAQEGENVRVMVHNGANQNLKASDLEKGIALAAEKKNVIFGYFTPNSMKKVVGGRVVSFLNRDEVFETQTPQISDLKTFVKAIEFVETDSDLSLRSTISIPKDEAELLNLIGEEIFVYECCPSNTKVTYASDFRGKGEGEREKCTKGYKPWTIDYGLNKNFRIGIGEDSHRFKDDFDPQKPLMIGGVLFPESKKTFDSNSDGDVILHSLCNAILSSVGAKTFDEFATPMCKKGVKDSEKYVGKTMEIVRAKYPKFEIINVVFSLEGKLPKLAPRHDELILSLRNILRISDDEIGVTYTSGEGLSSYGKGLGLYCLCNIFVQVK